MAVIGFHKTDDDVDILACFEKLAEGWIFGYGFASYAGCEILEHIPGE